MAMVMKFLKEPIETKPVVRDDGEARHWGHPTYIDVNCLHCGVHAGKGCRIPNGRLLGKIHKTRKFTYESRIESWWCQVHDKDGVQFLVVGRQGNLARIMQHPNPQLVGTQANWADLYFEGWYANGSLSS